MSKRDFKIQPPDYTTRQHYIPQFLLKNFTREKQNGGHIYEYKRQTHELRERTTAQIAFEDHLYSIETEVERDDGLEKIFSGIEAEAAPIIANIIKKRSLETETHEHIHAFFCFLVLTWCRSSSLVRIAEQYQADLNNDEKVRLQLSAKSEPSAAKQFLNILGQHKGLLFADNLEKVYTFFCKEVSAYMTMELCEIRKGYFILSDNYFIFIPKLEAVFSTPKKDFIKFISEIYCPIFSDLCIVFREKKSPDAKLSWHSDLQYLSELQFTQINKSSANSYINYLYCEDEATLRQFTESRIIASHIVWLKSSTALSRPMEKTNWSE